MSMQIPPSGKREMPNLSPTLKQDISKTKHLLPRKQLIEKSNKTHQYKLLTQAESQKMLTLVGRVFG